MLEWCVILVAILVPMVVSIGVGIVCVVCYSIYYLVATRCKRKVKKHKEE